MKKITTCLMLIFAFFVVNAQFSCEDNLEVFAVQYDLEEEWMVVGIYQNSAQNAYYNGIALILGDNFGDPEYDYYIWEGPIEIVGDEMAQLTFYSTFPEFCIVNFTPDINALLDPTDITITNPTSCNGSNGSICMELNSYPDFEFEVVEVSESVDGCVENLETSTYIVYASDWIYDSNGVAYSNANVLNLTLALQVDLEIDEFNDIAPLFGGVVTTSYLIEYNGNTTPDFNPPYVGPQCATLTFTDNTDCLTIYTEYVTECVGDIAPANDLDNYVNTADLLYLLTNWENPNFDPVVDLNCDGMINILDLLLLLSVFGTSC